MSELVLDLAADPAVAVRLSDRFSASAARIRLEDLRKLGARAAVRELRRRRLDRCVILVNDFRAQGRWLSIMALAFLVRARTRTLMDPAGREKPLDWWSLATREIPFAARREWIEAREIARVRRSLGGIRPSAGLTRGLEPRRVAFLRADLTGPLRAGGSLAHIHGVVSGFEQLGCEVAILTPGPVAGFEPDWDRVRIVPPDEGFRLSAELPALAYNARMLPQAVELLRTWRADLVYHRHALGCFAAAAAAGRCGLPLVVEFNGSETWIARKWGEGLRHLGLFEEVERRALRAADLVVAVSEPLLAQLGEMGVPPERVLVNPNGVDPDRFSGDALAERARWHRERLHLDANEILVGFVGTFGPWHGAEILAEAAARVESATARRLRYVFIGDGPRRAATERRLREAGLADRAAFVGLVPQEETPGLLVACDICASPHVPNEDGSAFFGSPTKLFEYMAGGRAILASRLDQIAEVLEHERNALLVPPSDPAALARGLERLAADAPLRERLGRTARQDAIRKHSWKHHVERILERLAAPAVPTASTR